jgi:hypothetical protein
MKRATLPGFLPVVLGVLMNCAALPALTADPQMGKTASVAQSPSTTPDPFVGTFRSANVTFVIQAGAGGYSGKILYNGQFLPMEAHREGPGIVGTFQANGEGYDFLAKVEGDTLWVKSGQEVYMLQRDRSAAGATGGSEMGNANSWNANSGQPQQASSVTALSGSTLNSLAANVRSGLKREKPETVLAQGDPPLTHAAVAAFAEIMRLAFDTELTETEFAQAAQLFVAYYQNGNAEKKKLLATTYQQVLQLMTHGTPEQQATATAQARETLGKQFAAGAQAGNPFALLCSSAIQRRQTMIATIPGPAPEFARQAGLHNQMSLADLDAAVEMLYFMWVAAGRDPRLVTPETVVTVRAAIAQNFPAYPQQLQYWFANGQKMYDAMRGEYSQAGRLKKLKLAFQYSGALDQLGLTVQAAQGGGAAQGSSGGGNNAWGDVGGQSHSAWAADMVQGLAGSSYHSSW